MECVALLRGSASRGARPPALATLGLASLLLAAPAHADEPLPPEQDTNPSVLPSPSTRPKLILIGAAVTAGWYGASYGMSYLWPDSDGAESLRIPVIGPYQALAKTGCGDREVDCGTFTVVMRTLLTGFAAVGQTGGILAMIEGVFVPTGIGSSAPAPAPVRARTSALTLTPVPMSAGVDGVGAGVVGTF